MRELRRVAVFCGSSTGEDDAFASAAAELGQALAGAGIAIVFGGSEVGLMGVLADSAMAAGGEVVGVYPEVFTRDVSHHRLSELRVVADMHERKKLMYSLADGVVALPGGLGTLEEVFEAATWNQLGLHREPMPIALIDAGGYYAMLDAFLDHAASVGLIQERHRIPIRLVESVDGALGHLRSFDFGAAELDKWG